MDYLSALNEKQLEAVMATEGYLRVISGAGSGKTKLLVSRYAYLVSIPWIMCSVRRSMSHGKKPSTRLLRPLKLSGHMGIITNNKNLGLNIWCAMMLPR